jgi:uncharacterized membrane protein
MNLNNLVSGTTGFIHLLVSIMALITGFFILVTTKGTKRHKQIGYIYAISMVILNLTAFLIYRLYGKFGIFHWFAVISCLTLFAGLYPVLTKRGKNYLLTHFNFMYWSVIGLYCAFMAETFVRLPKIILTQTGEPMVIFYKMVGISVGITMAVGIFFFIKFKPKWTKQYQKE